LALRIIDKVRVSRIERVIEESSNVRSLIFEDELCLTARPGQYVMIWLPEVGEFPMSVSKSYGTKSSIVFKAMGEGTRALFNSTKGDLLGIRGPYGTSFDVPKGARKLLLVGGGTGIAPILRLAGDFSQSRVDTIVVIGARTRNELPFSHFLGKLLGSNRVYPTTDDGTLGFKGFAHEQVLELTRKFSFDLVCCCGPEAMMLQIYKIVSRSRIPAQFSLERIMKCGIAICGSCCIQDVVLCRDGPVLDVSAIGGVEKEFAKFERDKTGALVKKF